MHNVSIICALSYAPLHAVDINEWACSCSKSKHILIYEWVNINTFNLYIPECIYISMIIYLLNIL
jgi:hypothetical protein